MAINYHATKSSSYYCYFHYSDAQKVADCLVNAFRDEPKFQKLLDRNKLLKAWVDSLDKKKVETEKAREAKARLAKQKEEVLAKLSEEEKIALGFAANNGKKITKAVGQS